jgi:hydrogenase expression/formation protein HypC
MCLAVPGRVESIRAEQGTLMGRVSFAGVVRDVCLAYVPDIAVGDYALVHVGFALQRIDEAAARDTLRTLAAAGLLAEELGADRGPDQRRGEAEPR